MPSIDTHSHWVPPSYAAALAREATVDREAPEVPSGEPGARCPVCQQGRMQLIQTLYRQQAAWDLSAPMPGFDTS